MPTGFWDQGFWGEGSESIKIIQKVNDELDHDKDLYSVPTGFWDQGYWGERSTESTKKIQIKRSAACIKSIQMAEGPGAELPDDLPTAQCEKNLHDSAPARYRHGSRGRKVRYSQLCAPFAPHRQPFIHHLPLRSPLPCIFFTLTLKPHRAVIGQSRSRSNPAHPLNAGPPGLRSAQQVWHVSGPEGLFEHHKEIDG